MCECKGSLECENGENGNGIKSHNNTNVDDYINQFKVLAGQAKIKEDDTLIEYFMEGLNKGILSKVFNMSPVPTTIADWYKEAAKFDAQY